MEKDGSKRVAVALSGGVDSAVAAALLKQQGHKVVGIFARGWSAPGSPCDWRAEAQDAARVAAHLEIPFREIDLGDAYEREVVRPMLEAYRTGRTPNPDVWCNRQIKFGLLADAAKEMGAKFLATGHYAQIKDGKLYRGIDRSKDQSYFLWTLTQKDLHQITFPLGNLKKVEVRALAQKFKLPNAKKPDSQGICFVGELDIKDFLRRELKPESGIVFDENNKEVGRHDGAILYTVGERVGFEITEPNLKGKPVYVVKTDVKSNSVTVSEKTTKILNKPTTLKITHGSETRPRAFSDATSCLVRYRGELLGVSGASPQEIKLASAAIVARGQSAVLYAEDGECLGGGEIEETR